MVVSVGESNVGEAGIGRYVFSTELDQGAAGVVEYWSDGVLGWGRSVSDWIELPLM
jgi:hypothetical protein